MGYVNAVDRDVIRKNLEGHDFSACDDAAIAHAIDHAPTLDVRPNVHAHWYKPQGMMPPEHHGHYECSNCGGWAMFNWKHRLELTEYCPWCGAVMDEEADNG